MAKDLEQLEQEAKNAVNGLKDLATDQSDYSQRLDNQIGQVLDEQKRVTTIYQAPNIIIKDIENDFKKATKLQDVDIAFLFFAAALQCLRQYLLTPMTIRTGDQTAAMAVEGVKEISNRSHRLYNPGLEEIITNPVPFDAIKGGKQYGALKGYGKLGHRGATPGHDPIAGLVFGTANIATSTLTNWQMESYHIYTGIYGLSKGTQDVFRSRAQTSLVLSNTFNKLTHQGVEGKKLVGASVAKEIVHLKSDVYSKDSLPLPLISAIDPVFAGELAAHGLDMANFLDAGKQLLYAVAIDTLISIVHGFFYKESDGSRRAFEIRTRRILLYSNLIATSSNVFVVATSKNVMLADWGGYLNTLRHLLFDVKFIQDVKRDFLKNELYDRVVGDQYDFMEGKI